MQGQDYRYYKRHNPLKRNLIERTQAVYMCSTHRDAKDVVHPNRLPCRDTQALLGN